MHNKSLQGKKTVFPSSKGKSGKSRFDTVLQFSDSMQIFLVKIYDPFIKMPTYKAIQSIHISQACVSSQYHNGLLKGHYLKWCKKHYFLSLETLHFYSLKNINKIVIRYFSLLSAFTQRYNLRNTSVIAFQYWLTMNIVIFQTKSLLRGREEKNNN